VSVREPAYSPNVLEEAFSEGHYGLPPHQRHPLKHI
jgi:hypothetical protein